jgi:hypothetical protein
MAVLQFIRQRVVCYCILAVALGVCVSTAADAANARPKISGIAAPTAKAGQRYVFQPMASDANGDVLTFSASGLPEWMRIDVSTGRVYGTPSRDQVGEVYQVRVTVSDGALYTSLPPFKLTVIAGSAPRISGTPPPAVTVGEYYEFVPVASDPNGQPLTFAIANAPEWASFDPATGRLSGTPEPKHAGKYKRIVIAASDGQDSNWLAPFTLVVGAGSGAAVVSWSAPTAYTDGRPLTDLAGYEIVYGRSLGDLSESVSVPNPEITSVLVEDLEPGRWYFAVRAYTSADLASELSSVGQKMVD